jgi:hypothetical protein
MGWKNGRKKEIAKRIFQAKKLDFPLSIHEKLLSEMKENSVTNGDLYSS